MYLASRMTAKPAFSKPSIGYNLPFDFLVSFNKHAACSSPVELYIGRIPPRKILQVTMAFYQVLAEKDEIGHHSGQFEIDANDHLPGSWCLAVCQCATVQPAKTPAVSTVACCSEDYSHQNTVSCRQLPRGCALAGEPSVFTVRHLAVVRSGAAGPGLSLQS